MNLPYGFVTGKSKSSKNKTTIDFLIKMKIGNTVKVIDAASPYKDKTGTVVLITSREDNRSIVSIRVLQLESLIVQLFSSQVKVIK
jgi:hypothetical protein